jgi:F-type H+-transporting ATPase subunit gamma
MAKARKIVKRRRAVQNIRKITQTMQLIATARYQKCLRRATASKPYTEKITEMIRTLASVESIEHPLLQPNEGVDGSLLLVITSNRGMCGAYNASVLRLAIEHRKRLHEEHGLLAELEVVGKKGINYLRFLGFTLSETIKDVEDRIAFARVSDIAQRYMDAYEGRRVARVDVAYTRYHSVGVQRPCIAELLPIEPPGEEDGERRRSRFDFEFSPPPGVLLGRLIPEAVRVRLNQCFNDALLSEQVARMVAMKAATDAAGDMIKYLTRQYNRARQTQITMELADIVGGSEAVR